MGEAYLFGNGGVGGKAFAAISVEYPAGSICTCSNGSKTLKAKDTSGRCLFLVPSGGEWTVKCVTTDGRKSQQKIITVTEKFSYSVTLRYIYYLFQYGIGLASGVSVKPLYSSSYSVTKNGIVWSTNTNVGNQLSILPAIDLSEYNTLHIELRCTDRYDTRYTVTVGVGSNHATDQNAPGNFAASKGSIYSTSSGIYTVDISKVSSTLFVKIAAYAVTGLIYNIWLD